MPGLHVFTLQEFIYSKVFGKSEMLPAMIEKDDIERNFEKFDEEMDSIDQAFEKIEGKFERLRGKRGARKTEEDSSNSGNESGSEKPKRSKNLDSDNIAPIIAPIITNPMKKVKVVCQRTSLKKDLMSKLAGMFQNQTLKKL